jgi:hypothetical protein
VSKGCSRVTCCCLINSMCSLRITSLRFVCYIDPEVFPAQSMSIYHLNLWNSKVHNSHHKDRNYTMKTQPYHILLTLFIKTNTNTFICAICYPHCEECVDIGLLDSNAVYLRLQPWKWRQYVLPKHRRLPTSLHDVTFPEDELWSMLFLTCDSLNSLGSTSCIYRRPTSILAVIHRSLV